MAVKSAELIDRTAQDTRRDKAADSLGVTQKWKVIADQGVTELDVRSYMNTSKGVRLGSRLSSGSDMFCTSVRCSPIAEDGQLWEVEAGYTRKPGVESTDDWNPLNDPADISFSFASFEEVVEKAYASWIPDVTDPTYADPPESPVVNTAGDKFDPPLSQERKMLVITIAVNVSTSDWSDWEIGSLNDTVNNADVTVAGVSIEKWAGRIAITGSKGFYTDSTGNTEEYMQSRIEITIHPNTWVRQVLNQGMRALIPGHGNEPPKRVKANESGYKDDDTPVLLDANGYPTLDPLYISFLTYREADWSSLDLPSDV